MTLAVNIASLGAAMTADSSGNVGIGTSSPTGKLNVNSTYVSDTTTQMRISDNTGTSLDFGGTGGGVKWLNSRDTASGSAYPLAFQTGGTERMRIDSSGRVTTPYQPAFYAYMNSGGSTSFLNGVDIKFDTIQVNTGSNYSTSTGRFTAPVAGWYHFSTTVLAQAVSNGFTWEIGLVNQSGGLGALGARSVYQSNYTGYGGYISATASCTIYLNVGDYMRVTNNSGTTIYINSGPWAFFSGHLIG